ncbi:MAG: ATP-binding protein [Opitutaceae bacterium]
MSRPRSPKATVHPIRDAFAVSAFVFIAAAAAIGWLTLRAHDAQLTAVRNDLARMARVAASTIDGDKMKELRRPEQQNSPEYKEALAPLVAFHRTVPELFYVYTVILKNGSPRFVLDTAMDQQALGFDREMEASELMEAYDDADPFMIRALTQGRVETTDTLYSDSYGTFLSGFAPIRDRANNLVGVVGVDLEVSDFQARMRGIEIAAIGSGAISALIAALVGFLVGYVRHRARQADERRTFAETRNDELIAELKENIDLIREAAEVNRKLIEAKEFDSAIPEVLRMIGTSYEVDRAYIFRRHPHPVSGRPAATQLFEWCREGVSTELNNPTTVDIDLEANGMAGWITEFDAGRDIAAHTRDLPEAAQRILSAQQIATVLLTPIMVNQTCWGFIGFDQCNEERTWTPEERAIFSNTVDALGTVLVRLETENRLTESRNLLDGVLAASVDGILAFRSLRSEDGRIADFELVLANPASRTMVQSGCPLEPGTPITSLLCSAVKESLLPHLIKVVENGTPYTVEYQKPAEGDPQWIRLTATQLDDGVTLTLSDISRAKQATNEIIRAKDAAEAADRAKSEFLAVMSHEIRTPMNGVIGFTNLLLETNLDSSQREYVGTIHQCGDSLLTLINDILDFSKIEAGQVELESNPVSLAKCVDDVIYLNKQTAASRSLKLKTEVGPDLPEFVFADYHRLRQILVNLVGNAVKFTKEGSVTVKVSRDSGNSCQDGSVPIRFKVVDTGIGIPEDKLSKLFKPFSQADSSTTRRYGGTGLGLAICRRLVELMHGEISVHSDAGTGSTFSFSIPLDPVPTETGSTTQEKTPEIKPASDRDFAVDHPLSILIAEDNRVNQQLIRLVLSRMGYQPDIAPDGRVATEAAGARPYDVILMDIQMPEVDGCEATRRIREREKNRSEAGDPTQPSYIIALTADAMQGDRDRCIQAGMNDYLSKPLRAPELRAALERCWAERRRKQPEADTLPPENLEDDWMIPLADESGIESEKLD